MAPTVFTVTRDTLENNGILFIRDVLRHNLTDPITPTRTASSWIVKSPIKNQDTNLPMVVLDQSSVSEKKLSFRDGFDISYNLGLMIWAKKLEERDDLADQIKVILQEDSNHDGTHTLLEEGLIYGTCESRNSDGYIEGSAELMRIKEMTITFKYIRR
jgi:hypothetical protein